MFKYQSGRVIALGRVMLALLFLLSMWLDRSQAAQAPEQTYALLLLYVLFAVGLCALTWRNWWLDARLAAPAHAVDMAVFTGVVFSTNGYTSPFFLFFILPLLSAAIRWGWRETAITAAALIVLYLAAGLLVTGSEAFELQRFIVRSGHLLILSAVLIWFGIHQQVTRLFFGLDEFDQRGARDEEPIAQALAITMQAARARSGALLLQRSGEPCCTGLRISGGIAQRARVERPILAGDDSSVVLFDVARNRSLIQPEDGWYRFAPLARLADVEALRGLGADEGFVSAIRTGTEHGWLVFWEIPDLSVDYVDLGRELGRAAGAVLEREALLEAIEAGAAARTRLSLARDVHDSVVQFLAGAAFRVEAMMRGARSGEQIESELKELKHLLMEEQGEIRTYVSALRRDRELELGEAVEELKSLARRLAQQWSVDCRVVANEGGASIPIRLQLDLQQLLREAVANAVRHGRADRIDIDVGVDGDELQLRVKDNGSGFGPANGGTPVEPWSLKERVDRAHGSLALLSEPGCTNVLITLPLSGGPA